MSISPAMPGSGSAPVTERRSHPRKSVMDRRLVTVNLDEKDAGLMVDISEAGMAVQALARIKAGSTTRLRFELPETAARIEAIGTIAWADTATGRAGIEFDDLPQETLESLKKWIEQQAQTPSKPAQPLPGPIAVPESKVSEIAGLQREIAAQALDPDAALAVIVQRARVLTRADGAAIVLGDAGLMTCRASDGNAPPVGVQVRPQSGLTGECVRTGVTVRCEDTELDPRVDREACRQMALRSALVVPLFSRGNISGLVEVFYNAPRAFEGRDVLMLRRLADLLSATLATSADGPKKSPFPVAAPIAVATAKAPGIPTVPAQPGIIVCDVCGHKNPEDQPDCEKCDVPLPPRVAATALVAPAMAASVPHPRVHEDAAPSAALRVRVNSHARMWLAVVLFLALAAAAGWYLKRRYRPAAPAAISTTSNFDQPTVVSASTLPAQPLVTSPIDSTPAFVQPAPSSTLPALSKPSASVRTARGVPEPATKPTNAKPAAPAATAKLESPAPVGVAERPARESQPVLPPAFISPVATPTVASILSPPQVAPKLAVPTPVVSSLVPARLLSKVEPVYPKLALQHRVRGAVVVKAKILRSGRLGDIQVQKGNEMLISAAIAALRQWRYKPEELDGKPIETETTITLNFSLPAAR